LVDEAGGETDSGAHGMKLSLRVKVLSTIAVLLGLGLIATATWKNLRLEADRERAAALATQSYPPPGKLVDIGGRRLHIDCTGSGSPTVILEAGGGAYAIDWALVQPKIAETTRVCSYDRAGLGWSDAGPADETVEETVSDLHSLLDAAGEKGPYVLVGASIGGIYIQAYQHAFPKDVAALVFTNSSGRVGLKVKDKVDLLWKLSEDEIRSVYPLPASAKGPAPTKEDDPFDRLPADLKAMRLWLDVRSWEAWNPAKTGPESMLSWRKEFVREFDASGAGRTRPLGELPVIVVASDPAAGESQCKERQTASSCLDYLSTNTVHIVAAGSRHEIHLYQPDSVIRAIEQAVSAVRGHTAVSAPATQAAS
jgi:pimeloyl-ACP methyl ester carboxylesterase